ncbi:DUF5999 family protein [Actinospica sp.]|jgi:hypothetical protein|uniref:DUF5999 family protein n=1 Tax=Actinospica sp. TaxID=1872142 RepID=UPI002CF9F823|nr:DUF5999 family protein [Actinospica sp.]HWG25832.1 DUF5999 family protein [Actinospica sp.]
MIDPSSLEAGAHPAPTPPCPHKPLCPSAYDSDRYRAHVLSAHPEQGWSLLCNGVIAFDDLGALLPAAGGRDEHAVAAARLLAA